MFRFVRPLAITAVMIAAVTSAQAHTSENVLFVCSGTLEGDHGYTINDKLDEFDLPDELRHRRKGLSSKF